MKKLILDEQTVRAKAKERGLTLNQVEIGAGWAAGSGLLYKMLKKRDNIQLSTIASIARGLRCDPLELIKPAE